MKKVCVIGLGYIGLPTASILASYGYDVHGVDIDTKVINIINNGDVHIYEPNLKELVSRVVFEGKLTAASEPQEADVYIIAVPTPFYDNHKPNLDYVEQAIQGIACYVRPGNIIILESTSPVGTTEKIKDWLASLRPDLLNDEQFNNVYISHCPERVLPGKILEEFITNDRIIGGINEESTIKTAEFYETFIKGDILKTNSKTAELAKLTENSFRDVNIAFANELSMICDDVNIDVWELIDLANHHPRVNILQPGPGVGGHCIAVDPWFIVDASPETAKLIAAARDVNDSKPKHIINKVIDALRDNPDAAIACLGLTFKADIDDLRESPSLEIVKQIAKENLNEFLVVEPNISALPKALDLENTSLVQLEKAISRAKIILILVDHKEFKKIDCKLLKDKIIIDSKGIIKINGSLPVPV